MTLDKPAIVAECSGSPQSCSDKRRPDAGIADAENLDVNSEADLGEGTADGEDPTNPDGGAAGTDGGIDGGKAETSAAADGSSDVPPADAPDAPPSDARDALADSPGGGPDAPDVSLPDAAGPDGADARAPDSGGQPDTAAPDAGGLDARADAADAGPTSTVTFNAGLARGPMNGYGWVTVGTADSITSPTCGLDAVPITGASPCKTHPNWSSTTSLCVTGSVPALPPAPTAADYAANWGLQVGVNAREPAGPLGKAFATIAINYSGAPASPDLRLELHRSGDPEGTKYCYPLPASGTAVLLTKFNTACWDGSGTVLAATDLPNIDQVSIQVSSLVGTSITVTNLCLNSIVLGE